MQPWIIAEKCGDIVTAHCNCMAGLGETCTHTSALLFAVEAAVKIHKSKTVTDSAAYWMMPGNTENVPFSEVRNINFTSARTLKATMDRLHEQVHRNDECERVYLKFLR